MNKQEFIEQFINANNNEMIIAEFNRPERVATGRETPENYLGFEIIAMDR